jgi:putative DNA methylase
VSTDPPYYDNIGYADLSDFFYVWLRRSLRPVYPDLFATLAVPKAEELVATPYRHGSKEKAETFFLDGMTQAMRRLAEQAHPAFPVTIYYAFKQAESDGPMARPIPAGTPSSLPSSRRAFAITAPGRCARNSATA